MSQRVPPYRWWIIQRHGYRSSWANPHLSPNHKYSYFSVFYLAYYWNISVISSKFSTKQAVRTSSRNFRIPNSLSVYYDSVLVLKSSKSPVNHSPLAISLWFLALCRLLHSDKILTRKQYRKNCPYQAQRLPLFQIHSGCTRHRSTETVFVFCTINVWPLTTSKNPASVPLTSMHSAPLIISLSSFFFD